MKIAVACVDMIPHHLTLQPWYYMNSIAKALSLGGHEVWILTDSKEDLLADRKIIVFKRFRSFPRGVNLEIGNLIKNLGFDAIIWSIGLTDLFFINKIDRLNIPVIGVIGSPRYYLMELLAIGWDLISSVQYIKQFFLGPLISQTRLEKFLSLPNLKSIVFQCHETLRRYFPLNVDKRKIFVIPPPFPEDFFNILKRAKLGKGVHTKRDPKILYFGPAINLRGINTLINASPLVMKTVKDVKLDILCRPEYGSSLKHERRLRKLIIKKGLTSNVNILSGMLTHCEIVTHILSSKVVCLPFECIVSDVPISVLETLATGVHLVTTYAPGISEFAKNANCTLIRPRDHKALADVLIKVLKNDIKIVDQFRIEEFLNKHSLRNFALSFEKILRETL